MLTQACPIQSNKLDCFLCVHYVCPMSNSIVTEMGNDVHLSLSCPTPPMHLFLFEVRICILSACLDYPTHPAPAVWTVSALAVTIVTCYGAICRRGQLAMIASCHLFRCCIGLLWCYLACLPSCLALCGSVWAGPTYDILFGAVWTYESAV